MSQSQYWTPIDTQGQVPQNKPAALLPGAYRALGHLSKVSH